MDLFMASTQEAIWPETGLCIEWRIGPRREHWGGGVWEQRFWYWGTLKVTGGSEGPARSPALNELLRLLAWVVAWREGKSGTGAPRSPIPSVVSPGHLWRAS